MRHHGEPWPDALRVALAQEPASAWTTAPVLYFESVGSTNDVALALAREGAVDGTGVIARAQSAGRGRLGRTWASPPEAGLYMSVVVRPPAGIADGARPLADNGVRLLTLAAAVAAVDAVAAVAGLTPTIKWPNDLVVEHQPPGADARTRRKLGGILTEGAVSGSQLQHVVVGIGINVTSAAYPPEVAGLATSIERETGQAVDVFRLFAACRGRLAQECLARWRGEEATLLERWQRHSPSSRGARVAWMGPRGRIEGTTVGIDASGALVIETDSGRRELVFAGEVEWI